MAVEQGSVDGPGGRIEPVDLKLDQPHSARMYDYYLDGKTHFPADRAAAEKIASIYPQTVTGARVNRAFMHRAIRCLAAEHGIRQFLDIGTGIPTSPNLHEVAQAIAPDSRVVYVDNDPIVLVHARALLTSTPEGRTAYLDADVRNPQSILAAPQLSELFDLAQPIALSVFALFHFVPDEDDPYAILRRLVSFLPSGSFLAMSHLTGDVDPESVSRGEKLYASSGITLRARSRSEFAAFFDGLDLIEPGIQLLSRWRPDEEEPVADVDALGYGAVARKP